MATATIKTVDEKGRLTLGKKYAGRTVEVEESENGILLRHVVAVPANEAWLWENERAIRAVRDGLEQAAAGTTAPAPKSLESALSFADRIPGED